MMMMMMMIEPVELVLLHCASLLGNTAPLHLGFFAGECDCCSTLCCHLHLTQATHWPSRRVPVPAWRLYILVRVKRRWRPIPAISSSPSGHRKIGHCSPGHLTSHHTQSHRWQVAQQVIHGRPGPFSLPSHPSFLYPAFPLTGSVSPWDEPPSLDPSLGSLIHLVVTWWIMGWNGDCCTAPGSCQGMTY